MDSRCQIIVYLGILCTGSINSSLSPTLLTPSVLYFEACRDRSKEREFRSALFQSLEGGNGLKRKTSHLNEVLEGFPLGDHVCKHSLSILALVVVGSVAIEGLHLLELGERKGEGW